MSGKPEVGNKEEIPKPQFPYVKYVSKDVALIGLSSSIATGLFMATGTLGQEQISKLKALLEQLKQKNVFRIILIHHLPLKKMASKRRWLTDAESLTEVLVESGAELILHGHNHRNTLKKMPSKDGIIPIIGVASASCGKSGVENLASYNLIQIDRRQENLNISVHIRSLNTENGEVIEIKKYSSNDLYF